MNNLIGNIKLTVITKLLRIMNTLMYTHPRSVLGNYIILKDIPSFSSCRCFLRNEANHALTV